MRHKHTCIGTGAKLTRNIAGWNTMIGYFSVTFRKQGRYWYARYADQKFSPHAVKNYILREPTLHECIVETMMHLAPDNRSISWRMVRQPELAEKWRNAQGKLPGLSSAESQ